MDPVDSKFLHALSSFAARPGVPAINDAPDAASLPALTLESIHVVVEIVSKHTGVRVVDIYSSKRPDHIAFARQLCMKLSYELHAASSTAIGEHFRRDHGTVLYACAAVEDRCCCYPATRKLVDVIRSELHPHFQNLHVDKSQP